MRPQPHPFRPDLPRRHALPAGWTIAEVMKFVRDAIVQPVRLKLRGRVVESVLHELDDRHLDDIGVKRSDIYAIAYGLVDPNSSDSRSPSRPADARDRPEAQRRRSPVW